MAAGLKVHFPDERAVMRRAIELARRGIGFVEPNPAVGAVIIDEQLTLLGEGYHQQFGGPHAEVHAIAQAGDSARGAILVVTLEPCSHFGKTPPCADAIIRAGIRKVIMATEDPSPHVSGQGIEKLLSAGVQVYVGLMEQEAKSLIAPFVMKTVQGRPFVHAKWAMTLDGRIASRTGHSQWISNESSRKVVHEIRGRMDAIVAGIGTVLYDDPLLTARPPGPRVALRVILDSSARLPLSSKLVQTARDVPLLVVVNEVSSDIDARCNALIQQGAEVLRIPPSSGYLSPGSETSPAPHSHPDLQLLLKKLAERSVTNLLVEGGSHVLGSFHDALLIDELHVFIAPKLVGGADARSPVLGLGREFILEASSLKDTEIRTLDGDLYLRGRL